MTRARSLSQLANSSVFTVATNNRVGIGSEVPTAKLDVDGTLNVSGNATIGGVATYEDVTNVDSVGIVTARSGVSVPDGQKIQLGNSNDLQIYHTGSHSLIDEAGTGNLTIRSSLISFEKYTNEQLARFTADGSCELFHDNSKKLETTSTGVSITGAGTFSSSITAQNTILANRTGSTQTAFQATLSGVTKVNIEAGGSANFASHLITGSANSVTSTSAHGSYIGEGIVVNAIQPNATLAAQERVWLGKLANVTKSQIFKDGSATFAGGKSTIDASNGYKFTSSTGAFGQINGDGIYQMQTDGSTVGAQILANGSATFSGGNFIISSGGTILADNGGNPASAAKVNINSNGTATFAGLITANGNILSNRTGSTQTVFQGTLSGVTKVNIQAGGAATFGQASNSTNNNGILLGADVGQLNLYTTRYNTDCFQILNTSGSGTNVAVRFDGNGTATFAGSVSATVGSFSGNVTSARTSSSHTCFNGTLNGTTTSNILADGSATLNGNVTSGAPDVSNGSAGGVQLFASGQLRIQRSSSGSASDKRFQMYYGTTETSSITANGAATFDSFAKAYRYEAGLGTSDGSTQLWTGRNSSSTATSKIFTDGSAEFAGAVDVGTFSAGTSGIRLTNSGTIYIGGTGNNAGLNIGNSAAVIDYDGSAAFAARLSPGTTSLNDHAIVAINNNVTNGVIVAQNMNNSGALLQGYNGSSVKNVEIFATGNVTFKGKLDVGNTYSGAEIARFGKTATGATSYLAFHTENANYAFIGTADQLISGGGAADFGIRAQGNMLFSTGGNSERMRISSAGSLTVSTYSSFGGNGSSQNMGIHQVTGGKTTMSSSAGWKKLFGSGHTFVGTVKLYVTSGDALNGGGVAKEYRVFVAYGSAQVTEVGSYSYGTTAGNLSNIELRYNNSGYQIQARVSWSSGSTPVVNWSAEGLASSSWSL